MYVFFSALFYQNTDKYITKHNIKGESILCLGRSRVFSRKSWIKSALPYKTNLAKFLLYNFVIEKSLFKNLLMISETDSFRNFLYTNMPKDIKRLAFRNMIV